MTSSVLDERALSAYLDRIGAERPRNSGGAALRILHRAHQLTVPFENLSMHLNEPISLDERDLIDKLVHRRRGGFCYELNGAFALMLATLGFRVELLAARTWGADGALGPPFDHLALQVHPADGTGPWLADVGYGRHSVYPLLLGERGPQDDPGGTFMLAEAAEGDVDVLKDGQPQYRIESRRRGLADFTATCWWQQTSPQSHFTKNTICSRLAPGGRVSISGRTLILATGGSRSEQYLASDHAVLAAYRDHFGITLDRVPALPQAE